MKTLYLIAVSLVLFSCNSGDNAEEVKTDDNTVTLSSSEYMNAYVDSINSTSDTLANMYGTILQTASRNIDSAKHQMMVWLPVIDYLNQRLDALNMAISNLKSQGKISEDDYETLSKEIDMNDLSQRAETLRTVGIDPRISKGE